MKFNSQICTTREQSERLIALGLKKETADCYYWQENDHIYGEATGVWHLETLDTEDTQEHFEYLDKYFGVCLADDEEHYFIPAWSLHRLLCLYGQDYEIKELYNSAEECYGMLITAIGRAIENEEFNEEYLNNGVYTH